MRAIFQESGNSPVVMHLLNNLDNHSDAMQLAILKNLDGMSLGEILDFILGFLMRSWISYASVGARYNENQCIENHALMLTMKRSDDSTYPYYRSPTPTLNGRDLTLPTRTQRSEQKYSDLAASNRRPSTPYSRKTPQSFSKGTQSM